jgi:hypothetical protein
MATRTEARLRPRAAYQRILTASADLGLENVRISEGLGNMETKEVSELEFVLDSVAKR